MSQRADDQSESAAPLNAEEGFSKLVEHSADGVVVVDSHGCVRFANATAAAMLRKPQAALIGYQFGYPAISSHPVEILIDLQGSEPAVAELRSADVEWAGGPASLINLRDVTLRERQQKQISRLNSALRTVLEVQELILRESDTRRLLHGVCQILLRRRDYVAACIVLRDDGDCGHWTIEANERRDAVGFERAVQLGELPPCCRHSLPPPPEVLILSPGAERCAGCAATAGCDQHTRLITPIQAGDDIFGSMILLAPIHQSGDSEELDLLQRLAANLGQALRANRLEAARRSAEDQLRESEAQFRRLFEHSIDAIVIADENGRYRAANPAACALFGYTREQLLAMSVGDLRGPEDQASAACQYREYLSNATQSGTFLFYHQDGSLRAAEYSAFPLGPGRFVSMLRDVTGRRSLEEQLRQSQKMEAVGRLAGGIAHDFNNLLAVIISFAGFVRDATPAGDARREDLDEVLRAADRASSLTRHLLAFSRRQPIAPRDMDLNELLADTRRLLRRTLGEDIDFVTLEGKRLWPVFIDPGQFEQVVLNLALNARDAMPSGGTLTIETRNEPGADPEIDPCVALCVRDTGVGMSDYVKAHLFEPFFTTKDSDKGTGLGLSMVYGLVTQAGGWISVESQLGRGTCFEIRLPRSRATAAREPAAGAPQPVATAATAREPAADASQAQLAGNEAILVVEDEPMVRKAAVRILRRQGYTVFEACGGHEALQLCVEQGPAIDLVLCDVIMPQMSGPEMVEALAKQRPGIKVLFMTGYAENTAIEHGVVDSSFGLLNKPFTQQGLLARVREALSDPA